MKEESFRQKLQELINMCSLENASDTPDYILATYLVSCLQAFDTAVLQRARHNGEVKGKCKCELVSA